MKIKDIIKKQTTIIAIAVVLVIITVIGVSYAIFFNVNRNTTDQVITAGNLSVTISATEVSLTEPMTTEEGLASTPITYTPSNTSSNLPADYSIYIYAGENNTIDLSTIKVSTDGTSSNVLTTLPTDTDPGAGYYRITTDTVPAGSSGTTGSIRIWIDEDLIADEITSQVLDLELQIVAEVDEATA